MILRPTEQKWLHPICMLIYRTIQDRLSSKARCFVQMSRAGEASRGEPYPAAR